MPVKVIGKLTTYICHIYTFQFGYILMYGNYEEKY